MTLDEFAAMVAAQIAAGKLSTAEAARLLYQFDIGKIVSAAIPLPLRTLPTKLTKEEFKEAHRVAAAYLTPKEREPFLNTAEKPRTTKTPPEVRKFLRERLRNHLRGDYERTMKDLARGLHAGGNVNKWHKAMAREQRAYIARQYTAGLGRALANEEVEEVNQLSAEQLPFLNRFASEASVRQLVGRPWSLAYLQNRSLQYGGVGWAAWFKGNERAEARGDGYIIKYIAVDDPRTCSPCHEAEVNGPYLPGATNVPYPGAICRGHGLCRCRHEVVFDMDEWRRLKGINPPLRKDATEHEREMQRLRRERRAAEKLKKKVTETDDELERLLKIGEEEAERLRIEKEEKERKDEEARLQQEEAERKRQRRKERRAARKERKAAAIAVSPPPPVKPPPASTWLRPSFYDVLDELSSPLDIEYARRYRDLPDDDTPLLVVRNYRRKIEAWIDERELLEVDVKTHGMEKQEEMRGFFVDEVMFRYHKENRRAAVDTLLDMYLADKVNKKIPQTTWGMTRTVYFTAQRNKADEFWSKQFSMPNFLSAATGGDGEVMVYNGKAASADTLAHEAAHNYALILYGKTNPYRDRDGNETEWKRMADDDSEKPVRNYGTKSPAEDFATAFEFYHENPEQMEREFPKRFALVDSLVRGEGEAAARKAAKFQFEDAAKNRATRMAEAERITKKQTAAAAAERQKRVERARRAERRAARKEREAERKAAEQAERERKEQEDWKREFERELKEAEERRKKEAEERKKEQERVRKLMEEIEAKKKLREEAARKEAERIRLEKEQTAAAKRALAERLKAAKREAKRLGYDPEQSLEELERLIEADRLWREELDRRIEEQNRLELERFESEKAEKATATEREIESHRKTRIDLSYGIKARREVLTRLQEADAIYNERIARKDAAEAAYNAHRSKIDRLVEQAETKEEKDSIRLQDLDNEIVLREEISNAWGALRGRDREMAKAMKEVLGLPLTERLQVNVTRNFQWDEEIAAGHFRKDSVDELFQKVEEARDFVQSLTAGDKLNVEVGIAFGRATAGLNDIALETASSVATIAHEIGHMIEYQRGPEWRAKRIAFYLRRTTGDKVEKLDDLLPGHGYGPAEVTKKDKFVSPYMGKITGADSPDHSSSEMISTGLTELYSNPLELLDQDPEFFDFILSYLRGTL